MPYVSTSCYVGPVVVVVVAGCLFSSMCFTSIEWVGGFGAPVVITFRFNSIATISDFH